MTKMEQTTTATPENEHPESVQRVEVRCCKCNAALRVKIGTETAMCPKCGEIFTLEAKIRAVKDVSPKSIAEAFVTVDKNERGVVKTKTFVSETEN